MVTLEQIFKDLESFQQRHYQLNSFYSGTYEELNTADIEYPMMWSQILPNGMSLVDGMTTYSVAVLVLDRYIDQVKTASGLGQVMEELVTWLNDNEDLEYNVKITGSPEFTVDSFSGSDRVTGWRLVLQFRIISGHNSLALPIADVAPIDYSALCKSLDAYTVAELMAGLTSEQIDAISDKILHLNHFFDYGSYETVFTITPDEAGTYKSVATENVATVTFLKNGVQKPFPFAVVAGDQLKITTTKTIDYTDSVVKLTGEYE